MIERFYQKFSKDLGIDLGTANTLVYVKGKGIVINEPSVVAINAKTRQVLAIGSDARRMVGRTPSHIVATRPLAGGVISDFEVTESMLKYFIDKVHAGIYPIFRRPRVVIGIPSGVTEVEKRAVVDAAVSAGAASAYLIEEPVAAAMGARLPVQDAQGSFIVDIGGGTTEIAVISLGGIVVSKSLRIAGDKLSEAIVQYVREKKNLLIGERTAEDIKISIGSVLPTGKDLSGPVRGRDIITGLPKEIVVSEADIREALQTTVMQIIKAVKMVVEDIPPEIISDCLTRGIVLAGGGALLRGFADLLSYETKLPVMVADDPLTCVVRGCGVVVDDLENLSEILLTTQYQK
ncbi:MAG TPA: rod shape-determining protein [Patescibacteria group bacterium]|nr:rod shape-determining protein [Patescibacteria group bacterium]